jgi:hypothetical protein
MRKDASVGLRARPAKLGMGIESHQLSIIEFQDNDLLGM